MAKNGHSRQTLFGYVNHYDSSGKKIGRSRRGLLDDDWVHYDEKGKRVAVTRNGILGGTYTTDVHGKRIGYSRENLVGGTNYYDTHGHLVGRSRDNILNGSTDSEGFANQTSTRSAERIMIAQPIEDNDDDFGDEEDEMVDQTENKSHGSYLGCCFFVAILIVAAILVGRALTR